MMLKHTLLLSGLLASCVAWSAATPRGSAYEIEFAKQIHSP